MAKIVVLDPGHGGGDPGAVGNGLQEKDINLAVVQQVQRRLKARFVVEVLTTRDRDVNVSLDRRARIANINNADLFCSIHVNSSDKPLATGFESYVYYEVPEKTKVFRSYIHSFVADCFARYGLPDRGKKTGGFAVLRWTKMPAVLLECGFISNSGDASLLADEEFRYNLGDAVACGVARALNLEKKLTWDPEAEIARLKEDGLINSYHKPLEPVTWGQFATVLNRLRDRFGQR